MLLHENIGDRVFARFLSDFLRSPAVSVFEGVERGGPTDARLLAVSVLFSEQRRNSKQLPVIRSFVRRAIPQTPGLSFGCRTNVR